MALAVTPFRVEPTRGEGGGGGVKQPGDGGREALSLHGATPGGNQAAF